MRLQLIALVATLAAPAVGLAQEDRDPGQGDVSSKLSVYADDDQTTVMTTAVDGEVTLPAELSVGAHVLVDAVSTASVDVVSAATGRWTENRVETGGRVGAEIAHSVQTSLRYVLSQENDWLSHSVQAGAGRDFADKNTRLEAAYGVTLNSVGRANDPTFEKDLSVHSAQAGLTQLWSETTLFQASYSLQLANGFMSSPYRYVGTASGMTSMPETHPDSRMRHAINFRALRSLGSRMAIDAVYRFYTDDWGIQSHTASTALRLEAGKSFDVRLRARGYYQTEADFYAESYDDIQRFMTVDRELSNFWDVAGGLKLAYTIGGFVIDAKVDAVRYEFLNFSLLQRRTALITDIGLRLTW